MRSVVLVVLGWFVMALGCGGAEPGAGARCEIGRSIACACASGAAGSQECSPAGVYGACRCAGIDGGADVGPSDAAPDLVEEPIACPAGVADCDHDRSNGCETTLNTMLNCGRCGEACAFPNAAATCAGGMCVLGDCNSGFRDCDGMRANGCEIDVRSDNMNCGSCALPLAPLEYTCRAGSQCMNGHCEAADCADGGACPTGSRCCPTPTHGTGFYCIDLSRTADHCGSCTNACPSSAHASPACSMGACGLACEAYRGDCDGTFSNGCEVDTNTSAANCGRCGNACPGAQRCVDGSCVP